MKGWYFFARNWQNHMLQTPANSTPEEIIYTAKCKTVLGLKRVILKESTASVILQVQYIFKQFFTFFHISKNNTTSL